MMMIIAGVGRNWQNEDMTFWRYSGTPYYLDETDRTPD